MRQRSLRLVTALVLVIAATTIVVAQRKTGSSPTANSPEVVLREFYKWYIHADTHDIDPLKEGKATLKKYVSVRFIREMERNEKLPEGEGFEADYFLQSQDRLPSSNENNEAEWLKSMSITNVTVKATTATGIVAFFDGYPRVKVTLIVQGSAWKIDKVRNAVISRPVK